MHAYVILSQIAYYFLNTVENDLFGEILSCIEIFFYQGTVLYELYFLLRFPLMRVNTGFERDAKEWILIEMVIYFFQMFNTAIFFLYIAIRGELGKTDPKIKDKKRRCIYDSIEYYKIDIEWLSFQLVLMGLHCGALYGRLFYE